MWSSLRRSLVRSEKSRTNFRHLQAPLTPPSENCLSRVITVSAVTLQACGYSHHRQPSRYRRHGGGNSSACVLRSGGGGQQQQGAGVWEGRGRSCREQRQAPTAAAVASAALTSIAEQAGPAHAAAAWQAPPPELTLPQRARWDCPLSRNHSLFESRDISKHGLLGFGRLRVWFSGRV